MPYSFADLFSGAGGLSLGLTRAGLEPVFSNEFSVDAEWTYRANLHPESLPAEFRALPEEADSSALRRFRDRGRAALMQMRASPNRQLRGMVGGPIQEAVTNDLLEEHRDNVDVLVGGPPCQGFSSAGTRQAEDKRNQLPFEMARVHTRLNPAITVLENVPGMVSLDTNLVKCLMEALSGPTNQYYVRAGLVRASDYSVPQTRRRVLLVALRRDIMTQEHLQSAAQYLLGQASMAAQTPRFTTSRVLHGLPVDPLYYGSGPTRSELTAGPDAEDPVLQSLRLTRTAYLGSSSPRNQWQQVTWNHDATKHQARVVRRLAVFQAAARRNPEHRANAGFLRSHLSVEAPELSTNKHSYRVLLPDLPPDITVTSLPDDLIHHLRPRIPTVREMARLQTFPDWFVFHGVRTTGFRRRRAGLYVPQYTQVANAVPVEMAYRLGERLSTLLDWIQAPSDAPWFIGRNRRSRPGTIEQKLTVLNRCFQNPTAA